MTTRTPWQDESNLIAMIIATGLIQGEQALSALLVSPKGSGKSTLMARFEHIPSVAVRSDLTITKAEELLDNPVSEYRTLMLPELNRLFARDARTAEQVLDFLNSAMTRDLKEEGRGTKDTRNLSGKQIGLITAMTTPNFIRYYYTLEDRGMLSRFIVFGLKRDEAEEARVLNNILSNDTSDKVPYPWRWGSEQREIHYEPRTCRDRLHSLYVELDVHKTEDWRRTLNQLIILVKGIALLNGRDYTTPCDVDQLAYFKEYLTDGIADKYTAGKLTSTHNAKRRM